MVFRSYRTTYRNVPTDRFQASTILLFPSGCTDKHDGLTGAAVGSRILQVNSMIGRLSLNSVFFCKMTASKHDKIYIQLNQQKQALNYNSSTQKLVEKIAQKAVESWPAYLCFHWQAVGALVNHAGLGISCFQ